MRKFIAACLLCLPLLSVAQSTNITTLFKKPIKRADHYFNRLAYRNALNLYLHANDRKPNNIYVEEQIAECYFKLHDPVSAEPWYARLAGKAGVNPETLFEYGEVLSLLGKYDESLDRFSAYLKEHPESKIAQEKVRFLERIYHFTHDTTEFTVVNGDFNSDHTDYGAHYFHNGIAFASSRDRDYIIEHKAFDAVLPDESLLNMYYVEGKSPGNHGKPTALHSDDIKSYLHEGPMAFHQNDLKAGLTRTNMKKSGRPIRGKDKQSHLQIYFADVAQLYSLTNITAFPHNNREYSVAHPAFSENGSAMYFSSTAPGGFGGSDLYVSRLNNGTWSAPENLGPKINTTADESFPFLANDSTLYFSSNGHGSVGGLDILVSYRRNGSFMRPVNFGSPINTRYDDFSLVTDSTGRLGYFSSNRPGGKGVDDIYYFEAHDYFMVGTALDGDNNLLDGVKLIAFNGRTGARLDSAVTDKRGIYDLRLPFNEDIRIIAIKDGYETLKELKLSTKGSAILSDSLSIPMWKQNLYAKGSLYDNETQQGLTGVTIQVKNVTRGRENTIQTGSNSDYSVNLMPESMFTITYSKEGYLPRKLEINTAGILKGDLRNDIVLEREFADMVTIGFAYKKATVTADAKKQLDVLVNTLASNPAAKLNIGAHADARGSVKYNLELTNTRARNTMKYFVSKGIDMKRITYKGFGEQLLLNRCSDGVKCTEDDHKINRRAEVKVIR